MSWFALVRIVVWLKRISRAQDRQADALETLARIAVQEFQRTPSRRKATLGMFDADEARKDYERRLRGEEPA